MSLKSKKAYELKPQDIILDNSDKALIISSISYAKYMDNAATMYNGYRHLEIQCENNPVMFLVCENDTIVLASDN